MTRGIIHLLGFIYPLQKKTSIKKDRVEDLLISLGWGSRTWQGGWCLRMRVRWEFDLAFSPFCLWKLWESGGGQANLTHKMASWTKIMCLGLNSKWYFRPIYWYLGALIHSKHWGASSVGLLVSTGITNVGSVVKECCVLQMALVVTVHFPDWEMILRYHQLSLRNIVRSSCYMGIYQEQPFWSTCVSAGNSYSMDYENPVVVLITVYLWAGRISGVTKFYPLHCTLKRAKS